MRVRRVRTADPAMASPAGHPHDPHPRTGGGRGRPARGAPLVALRRLAALFLLAIGAGCASGGVAAGPAPDPRTLDYAPHLEVDFSRMEETSSGLWIEVIAEGVGRQAMTGRETLIQYIGYLPDGTVVDASVGGEPFAFDLGSPEVIRAWNEGIAGMKVGGRRRLVVRPGLGYGSRGREPAVPPQSVLVFEIQLVDVR